MSVLDTVGNNFRFHDKFLRAFGYFLKSISYTEALHGRRLGSNLSNMGSKISWVRNTLRIGSELSIIKTFIGIIKGRKDLDSKLFVSEVIESCAGLYFYVLDHWEWAATVGILNLSKEMYDKLDTATIYSWLYSTLASTAVRLISLYLNWKASKDPKKCSKEEKQKLYGEKKTLLFNLLKGFIDMGLILYYIKPHYAFKSTISYMLGVIVAIMDMYLIIKGGHL